MDTCPEVFKLNEDDIAEVLVAEVTPELLETCREAAQGCPVEAIMLEE